MKGGPGWHPLLPRSFFGRTILLVLMVTLFSQILTLLYLLSNEDLLVDRQYSHGTAMLVRAYWASGPDARRDIEEMTGIRITVPEQVPRVNAFKFQPQPGVLAQVVCAWTAFASVGRTQSAAHVALGS